MLQQRNPGLDVLLPVVNIGSEEADGLKQELVNRAEQPDWAYEPVDADRLRKLLHPAVSPRIYLAHHVEITKLAVHAGVSAEDEDHMIGLKDRLDDLIPDSWREWTITAPTLPTETYPVGTGLALAVAGSGAVLKARSAIKKALLNYHGLESAPDSIWFHDRRASRPWLARSYGETGNDMLEVVKRIVNEHSDGTILPSQTKIGGVELRPYPPDDNA